MYVPHAVMIFAFHSLPDFFSLLPDNWKIRFMSPALLTIKMTAFARNGCRCLEFSVCLSVPLYTQCTVNSDCSFPAALLVSTHNTPTQHNIQTHTLSLFHPGEKKRRRGVTHQDTAATSRGKESEVQEAHIWTSASDARREKTTNYFVIVIFCHQLTSSCPHLICWENSLCLYVCEARLSTSTFSFSPWLSIIFFSSLFFNCTFLPVVASRGNVIRDTNY